MFICKMASFLLFAVGKVVFMGIWVAPRGGVFELDLKW